jgi:hypothetical protein
MFMSRDLAVMRWARNVFCGVACGWNVVVCLQSCLRLFLVAFFERVCGSFLSGPLEVVVWSVGVA